MDKIRIIDKPAKFHRIILPEESFFGKRNEYPRGFTKEYIETIEQVRNYAKKNFTKIPQKNFFFHHDRDKQIGAERLAKFFDSKGYVVVKPENFSLDEQLNILTNCERFASTVGSCSHNSMFLRDHSEVLLIPRSATRIIGYQDSIDRLHDKKTFYVDSALSAFATQSHGPFCYLISPQLKKFFGNKGSWEKADFEIFLQYSTRAIEEGFKPLEKAKNYYSDVMKDFIKRLERHKKLTKNFKYLKYLKENFLW